MKRCPECRRDYYDDSLLYCLDDGSALLEGPASGSNTEPATAVLPGTPSDSFSESDTKVLGEQTVEEPAKRPATSTASKRHSIIAGVAGILLLTALGFGSYWLYNKSSTTQIESIAVLPFVNEGGNPDLEYLSDGMTESLISSLSELPNMSVKARSSVFRYKDKNADPRTVGKDLNVQAILNGRVVQRGSDVVLYLELVDTESENVLLKADYNRPLANLVALQTEIARDISNRLRTRLTSTEKQQVEKSGTQNAEAYQLYLKGRFHWNKRRTDEHRKAIQYFEKAIALDPHYALAYSGLADCFAVDSSPLKGEERISKLRTSALKAMELDPTLGEPHAALANAHWESFDWPNAEKEFKRAIELSPNYATAHQWYGELLGRLGRHDEGIAELDRGRELDPLSLVINSDLAFMLILARRYDEAIEKSRKTLEMDPRWRPARNWLTFAYEMKGMFEEALAEYDKGIQYSELSPEVKQALSKQVAEARDAFRKQGATGYWRKYLEFEKGEHPDGSEPSAFLIASYHAILGEKEEAFGWISKAIDENEDDIDLLKVDPSFDNLRSDPRWPEVLKRISMTP